jgi:hypothetical protein
MSRPEEPIHVSRYAHASDAELHAAFEEVRGRVADLAPDSTRAVIADIELEAMRRGLPLPSVAEPMPAELALQRCLEAVRLGNDSKMVEWMPHLDTRSLWRVWLASGMQEDKAIRIRVLKPLLTYAICAVVYGGTVAGRSVWMSGATQNAAGEEAYLDQCICTLLSLAPRPDTPPS